MPAQVAEVAEQLQQLPLGCSSSQAQQQHQLAIGGPSDRPRAGHHAVKRYRAAGPAPVPAPSPAAAGGFRSLQQHQQAATAAGAGQRGACELAEDMIQASPVGVCRAAGGLHPMAKSMSPGGGGRPGWGAHSQQQQQQMGLQESGPGAFGLGNGAAPAAAGVKAGGWGQGGACQQQACMNNLGGQQHMAPAGPVHSRGAMEVLRCNSVNAMMQATVTDTLFFA